MTAPYSPGDRVIHPSRGAGIVTGVFQQSMGARKWICWVSHWKGEAHAVDASLLVADPAFVRPPSPLAGDPTKEEAKDG